MGFPGYSVGEHGEVRNDATEKTLTQCKNFRGHHYVGLVARGKQYKRAVSVLVANAFILSARSLEFNSTIHLDGNKSNNFASNLAWRPHWFAIQYTEQFKIGPQGFARPVQEIKSEEVFPTSWDASLKYGILEREIVFSIMRRNFVWPTFQTFRLFEP